MAKSPTIDEVKKAKISLEKVILKALQDFEKEYGVRIDYINVQREREDEDIPEARTSRSGPIKNIEANMELDLIY
jgi:hypothetical protein